jgi:UrcA family protein
MNSNTRTDSLIFSAFSAAVLITCLFVVTSAFAGEPGDQIPNETVKFQDLNVSSPAGVAALYQRIHAAARRVCKVGEGRDLEMAQRAKTCANEAEARAVTQVDSAGLTSYYQMKTGRQAVTLTAGLAK